MKNYRKWDTPRLEREVARRTAFIEDHNNDERPFAYVGFAAITIGTLLMNLPTIIFGLVLVLVALVIIVLMARYIDRSIYILNILGGRYRKQFIKEMQGIKEGMKDAS